MMYYINLNEYHFVVKKQNSNFIYTFLTQQTLHIKY